MHINLKHIMHSLVYKIFIPYQGIEEKVIQLQIKAG